MQIKEKLTFRINNNQQKTILNLKRKMVLLKFRKELTILILNFRTKKQDQLKVLRKYNLKKETFLKKKLIQIQLILERKEL